MQNNIPIKNLSPLINKKQHIYVYYKGKRQSLKLIVDYILSSSITIKGATTISNYTDNTPIKNYLNSKNRNWTHNKLYLILSKL